jgi:hypothetical protein
VRESIFEGAGAVHPEPPGARDDIDHSAGEEADQ